MDDELQRLRARAYGPDADIAGDPAALRRLAELEERQREAEPAASPPGDHRPDEADSDGARRGASSANESAAHTGAQTGGQRDAQRDAGPSPRRITRWLPGLWAVSLLLVAALAAVMTFTTTTALLRPVPIGQTRQVATIELGSDFLAPRYLGLEQRTESRGHRDWYGLTILVVRGTWYGDTEDECLVIMRQADVDPNSDALTSPMFTGCGAGGLPAVLQLRVNDVMPDELREEFPSGTGLRFVLDGSRVGVFVAAD